VPRHEPDVEGVQEERVEKERPPDEDEVPVNEGVDLRQGRMVAGCVLGWVQGDVYADGVGVEDGARGKEMVL
jgi:hypothetical protein